MLVSTGDANGFRMDVAQWLAKISFGVHLEFVKSVVDVHLLSFIKTHPLVLRSNNMITLPSVVGAALRTSGRLFHSYT